MTIAKQFGLTQNVISEIQSVFAQFDEIDTVILYGSRAKGNYKNGSDIDLTIKININTKPEDALVFRVIDALDALDFVYSFDVSLFSQIKDSDLVEHINRVGMVFYEKEKLQPVKDIQELPQRYEINVAYILRLLAALHATQHGTDESKQQSTEAQRKAVLDLLGTEPQLRSKRELIERFINEQMPRLAAKDDLVVTFSTYWDEQREAALKGLCEGEGLIETQIRKVIDDYNFTGHRPLRNDIVVSLKTKPKILERKKIIERVIEKIFEFVRTFEDDMGSENDARLS